MLWLSSLPPHSWLGKYLGLVSISTDIHQCDGASSSPLSGLPWIPMHPACITRGSTGPKAPYIYPSSSIGDEFKLAVGIISWTLSCLQNKLILN